LIKKMARVFNARAILQIVFVFFELCGGLWKIEEARAMIWDEYRVLLRRLCGN